MIDEFLKSIDKIHTTELGVFRIKRNIGLKTDDVVSWCREYIRQSNKIIRKGKNWYIHKDDVTITVNATAC
jgi:hypothetical protein